MRLSTAIPIDRARAARGWLLLAVLATAAFSGVGQDHIGQPSALSRPPRHKTHGTGPTQAAICWVQRQLGVAGYDPGPVDCRWGTKTTTALTRFQSDAGLSSTGTLDPATTRALLLGRTAIECHRQGSSAEQCLKSTGISGGQPVTGQSAPPHKSPPRPQFSHARCANAYAACIANCGGPVFDYEEGEYRQNTDFEENCEGSCLVGGNNCDDADVDQAAERCDEFQSSCDNDCESDAFDYDRGEYLLNTDADELCGDACSAGEAACS